MKRSRHDPIESPAVLRSIARRDLLLKAASGTVIAAVGGGLYALSDRLTREARAQTRGDGRPRLPPGQRVIESLKPMGGQAGEPTRSAYRLEVHGEVETPLDLDFRDLLGLDVVTQRADVHCVTGWSVLGAKWKGVRVKDLAEKAGVKSTARHVIFEAAHGYTANVRLSEATTDDVLVAWELDDRPLRRPHGSPVRAVVPDLYFWKSSKWLTGIKFVRRDEPGYWEVRGYNNHADPWKEERYA
jgi:DMSO/TMAO reductase YedYZ molybdopterin-dependent catalytic subunit